MTPDVILVDIAMPVMNGFVVAARIKAALPKVNVIYLTMNYDPQLALRALDEGASGFALKTCAASQLLLVKKEQASSRSS
jgi:DNA-binding NarL/FixJ family response regulator